MKEPSIHAVKNNKLKIGLGKDMSVKWTQEQKKAIYSSGGTILVSAAAGSGKTAVLVERIIQKIICKEKVSIDKLLVVTFSNDAAKEMKDRISTALSNLYLENPDDTNLKKQQIMLQRGNISTVHAFCLELIKNNYHALNLPPDFRIADAFELEMMKREAIEKTIEDFYNADDEEMLNEKEITSKLFSDVRGDTKLINAIMSIYSFAISCPFPQKELEEFLQDYKNPENLLETNWGKFIIEFANEKFESSRKQLEFILRQTLSVDLLEEKYNPAIIENINNIKNIQTALEESSYSQIFDAMNKFDFVKMPIYRKIEYKELIDEFKPIIEQIKSQIAMVKNFFFFSENEIFESLHKAYPIVFSLVKCTKQFMMEYAQKKADKSVLDFNDIEQLTIKLLISHDSGKYKRTELAIEVSKQFEEIMVDEYQDINPAQNMIFKAVSRDEKNIFMVGDAKQGIYRFRQAIPELFIQKKKEYTPIDENIFPAKIMLNQNFRSRSEITSAINCVFSKIMTEQLGEIEYNEEEMLNPGASFVKAKKNCINFGFIETDLAGDEKIQVEAQYVAREIKKLLEAKEEVCDKGTLRPCKPDDFCVMLRSVKGKSNIFLSALAKVGISAIADTGDAFFETKEINIAVSVLETINNPLLDIPLIATMMSPIFEFTATDIARLKNYHTDMLKKGEMAKESSFFLILTNFINIGNEKKPSVLCEKVQKFISQIETYRILSATMTTDKLMHKIFDDTNFYHIVSGMRNGENRIANLHLFVSLASSYEKNGYKGLSSFIKLISRISEEKSGRESAATLNSELSSVRIMSIHKTKGLEFPFCFICNLSKAFFKRELYENIVLNKKTGLGVKVIDENLKVKCQTLPFMVVAKQKEAEMASEEMRILYVALTRAKERLFFVAADKNILKKVETAKEIAKMNNTYIHYYASEKANYLNWIMLALGTHPDLYAIKTGFSEGCNENSFGFNINVYYDRDAELFESKSESRAEEQIIRYMVDEIEVEAIKSRIDFVYPYSQSTKMSSKISVSQLTKSNVFDDQERLIPSFESVPKNENTTHNSAYIGTAVHRYLQVCSFENSKTNFEQELKMLIKKALLTSEQASVLSKTKLKGFFESKLVAEIIDAQKVMREVELLYKTKIGLLDNDIKGLSAGDEVVVQGIADCIFKSSKGNWFIVDYKTDKVNSDDELILRYKNQLLIYKNAAESLLGEKIQNLIIHSLYLEKSIFLE